MRRRTNHRPPTNRLRQTITTPNSCTQTRTSPTTRSWVGTDAHVVRHVRVCGDGNLAMATRIELERQGIQRDTDYLLPSLRPALLIACADSEADQSFVDMAQQAMEEGSPLLLCCLAGSVVRIGPLIDSSACFAIQLPAAPHPAQRHADNPPRSIANCQAKEPPLQPSSRGSIQPNSHSEARHDPVPVDGPPGQARFDPGCVPARTDTPHDAPELDRPPQNAAEAPRLLSAHARLGALLITTQALNFILGARNQCVLDRVVELNPSSVESKGYSMLKVRQ